MFIVVTGDKYGVLTWCSTLDTQEDAVAIANETELKDEETVMVISVVSFRQQV